MKITKYPQSCLMVETNNIKFLIDPGRLKYDDEFLNEWKETDFILVTHKHQDHIKIDAIKEISKPTYSTSEVQNTYKDYKFNIVKENDILKFGNVKIEVVKAIHGYNPLLKGNGEVFENVGFIIDDSVHRLYITSDTICFNNDYKCDVVALPITAHGLTMSSYEAALFAKELESKLTLVTHMDNDFYETDINYMKENFKEFDINYKVLNIKETIEL